MHINNNLLNIAKMCLKFAPDYFANVKLSLMNWRSYPICLSFVLEKKKKKLGQHKVIVNNLQFYRMAHHDYASSTITSTRDSLNIHLVR